MKLDRRLSILFHSKLSKGTISPRLLNNQSTMKELHKQPVQAYDALLLAFVDKSRTFSSEKALLYSNTASET